MLIINPNLRTQYRASSSSPCTKSVTVNRERDSLLVRVWKIKYLATVMRNEEGYFCFNQSDYTSYAILHYVHP